MNYMIAGGGTGGHIFPAIAIGDVLKDKVAGANVLFVGTRYGMEHDLVPKFGYRLLTLPIRGLIGKSLAQKLQLLWRVPLSIGQSFLLLLKYRPKVVIGVGGYASAPLLWVAGLLRIPTMIQEQNAYPGLSNRLLAPWVKLACCGFEEAQTRLNCLSITTGNPVRKGFAQAVAWRENRQLILVLGGSQGAAALNRILPEVLADALAPFKNFRIVHQCGHNHLAQVQEAYRGLDFEVEVTPFIEDLCALFNQALLVICRSGASTIAELMLVKVPAILVPFPRAAHDHQTFNAASLEKLGCARLVREEELAQAATLLRDLFNHPPKLAKMAAAYPLYHRESAELCATIALALQDKQEVSKIVKMYGTHFSEN